MPLIQVTQTKFLKSSQKIQGKKLKDEKHALIVPPSVWYHRTRGRDKFHPSLHKPLLGFHKEISTVCQSAPAPVTPPSLDDSAQHLLEVSQPWRVVGTVPEQLHIFYRHRRRKSSTFSTVCFYLFNFHLFGCISMFHVLTILSCVTLLRFNYSIGRNQVLNLTIYKVFCLPSVLDMHW